jgi:peptide-methionine (R)-S-oxide reductase
MTDSYPLAAILAGVALLIALVAGCRSETGKASTAPSPGVRPAVPAPLTDAREWASLTEQEWAKRLTPAQVEVLRQKGTEPAFTGAYHASKKKGIYHCAGCDLPLYPSATKFDSGTGWPSFWAPVSDDAVATETDRSYGWVRTELLCRRCGGHLGHVFDDGPAPTGKRHCINSISLRLVETKR